MFYLECIASRFVWTYEVFPRILLDISSVVPIKRSITFPSGENLVWDQRVANLARPLEWLAIRGLTTIVVLKGFPLSLCEALQCGVLIDMVTSSWCLRQQPKVSALLLWSFWSYLGLVVTLHSHKENRNFKICDFFVNISEFIVHMW